MTHRIYVLGFAALVLALSGAGSSALAKTPAALILDSANVTPAPTAYSEIAPGTTYNLGKTGTLSFVHYGLCKEITVMGGKVTLDAKKYTLAEGGKLSKETAQPCPQQLSLAASTAVAGGVVMRGASSTPTLAPTANVLLVGAGASQVTAAKLMDADKRMSDLSYDATTHKVSSASALKSGSYTLMLQANGKSVAEWSFKVADQAQPGTVIVQIQ
ncbi:MAG: hypothetical protein QM537_02515 [Candidatus Symbiobacter sp.]|nr:hypothetical protein [Candidatus Symbiobacter sp.]